MIQQKKKLCSVCDTEQYLWKSNPPLCAKCASKQKTATIKVSTTPIRQRRLKKPHEEPEIDYKQLYIDYFGYTKNDFIPCELTGGVAIDINHIDCKGMGGSKLKDHIENLMAITRELHTEFGDIAELKEALYIAHNVFMQNRQPIFNFKPTREDLLKFAKEYVEQS